MTIKRIELRLSSLQVALLTILLQAGEKKTKLTTLTKSVYHRAGKTKPMRARQSIAVLVRSTDIKLRNIQAQVVRRTPIGRGNEAEYCLTGNLKNVTECVAWNVERFSA